MVHRVNPESIALIISASMLIILFLLCLAQPPERICICGEVFYIQYFPEGDVTLLLLRDYGRVFLKGDWTTSLIEGHIYILNLRATTRRSPTIYRVLRFYEVNPR